MLRPIITFLALACGLVSAQRSQKLPSSFPHDYPGKPSGAFGPEWQKYFEVTDQLPNVTFPFARNFAGNIPVDRPNHPNNTLFFWAFEKENGSLTANAGESNEPWGLWLNGGPGSSSLIAALFENGLLQIQNDYTIAANNWSWNQLADYVWIDQPVGVGFSTVDSDGYVKDEDQMATDFFGFLANLVKVFPSLQNRPLYITGESYAGTYIPYLVKAYFGMTNPPVKLAKFVIGDGTLNTDAVGENLPALSVIETYPQLIGYDPEVYGYFKEQSQLCGYDLNLTYPQNGHFPNLTPPGLPDGNSADSRFSSSTRLRSKQALLSEAKARLSDESEPASKEKRDSWLQEKRDLSGRPNGTIDTFYGCFLWAEMMDYALNFSLPWVNISNVDLLQGLDLYDLPDGLDPETVRSQSDAAFFLNDNRTRTALHAPTSKNWVMSIRYPFGNVQGSADPSKFACQISNLQF
ncbi:hypothetical protein QCA50_011035 [Cerrena zonata]|uniref:Carboxypeptidase n=1 Tax=Cerrena zonata TaxID=2478898 RepID=A0AAW0FXZ6_9APHY